jgi:hypothetical protein
MKMLENTPTYGQLASLSSFQYIWCLNFFDKKFFRLSLGKISTQIFSKSFFSNGLDPMIQILS